MTRHEFLKASGAAALGLFFNLINRANFGQANANLFTGPAAGQISALATPPLQIQFALKLIS
jgi:hypothetical protein